MTTGGVRKTSGKTILPSVTPPFDADDEDIGSSGDINITNELTTARNSEANESLGSNESGGQKVTVMTLGILLGILTFIILLGFLFVVWRKRVQSRSSSQDHAEQQGQFKKKFEESGAYKNNSTYAFPDPSSVASSNLHVYDVIGPCADIGATPYETSFTTAGANYENISIIHDNTKSDVNRKQCI